MLTDEGTDNGAANFSLQSGTDSFVSRTKDVFASLEVLEEKHSAFLKAKVLGNEDPELMKNDPEDEDETGSAVSKERINREQRSKLGQTRDSDFEPRSHSRSPNRNSKQNCDKEVHHDESGVFKRPNRMPRHQYVPDFKKHPEKYTCYTLSDVSEKDMSEKSNQSAAFAFLEEQRLNREKRERELLGILEGEAKFDTSDAACSQGKITFSRPRAKKDPQSQSEQKDSLSLSSGASVAAETVEDVFQLNDVKGDKKMMEAEEKTFKSRKNVRRQIRKGDNKEDSD